MSRVLYPHAVWAIRGLIALCVIGLLVGYIAQVHRVRVLQQEVCAARLEALRARNVFADRFMLPADACVALGVVTGRR